MPDVRRANERHRLSVRQDLHQREVRHDLALAIERRPGATRDQQQGQRRTWVGLTLGGTVRLGYPWFDIGTTEIRSDRPPSTPSRRYEPDRPGQLNDLSLHQGRLVSGAGKDRRLLGQMASVSSQCVDRRANLQDGLAFEMWGTTRGIFPIPRELSTAKTGT